MGDLEVTANIKREGTLFRLEIVSWSSAGGGMPEGHVQTVEKKFFSIEEACACARNEYGILPRRIRLVSSDLD
jgi:hypothetical protein